MRERDNITGRCGVRKYKIIMYGCTLTQLSLIVPLIISRLIILMGLMLGVLYSLHLLVKDYQALTGPKLLRLLFKRDANATNSMVRTKVKTVTQM